MSPLTLKQAFCANKKMMHFHNIPGLVSGKKFSFLESVLWLQEDIQQSLLCSYEIA